MKPRWPIHCIAWACCIAALVGSMNLVAAETESANFREILELTEIGPDVLTQLGEGSEYSDEDWQLLLQVFHRLQQFRDPEPVGLSAVGSPAQVKDRIGEIVHVGGILVSVEKIALPEKLAKQHNQKTIYRCQLVTLGNETGKATILSTHVPKSWHTKKTFGDAISVRGVNVQFSEENKQVLILTNHIAWFPRNGVATGQLLLARHGMDIALLDEVRHKQPFVKPEISHEGEAFYAALAALDQVSPQELIQQAKVNVANMAARWQGQQADLRSEHQKLEAELAATTDSAARESLQQQIKQAKKKRGLAAAVVKQAEAGRSSVAPMFLQPEKEVGELYVFEGTARRAVRIAVGDGHGTSLAVKSYFELEVFTNDSQNLPIVCCVPQLPDGFPTGDEIRESVRISGIFFKLWRYRSRKLAKQVGETTGQRQLYTPVVLGHSPAWLKKTIQQDSRWALWGGIAFLGGLMVLWIYTAVLARRDRRARTLMRRSETIDL